MNPISSNKRPRSVESSEDCPPPRRARHNSPTPGVDTAQAAAGDAYVKLNLGGKHVDVPRAYLQQPTAGIFRRATDGSMHVERDDEGRIRVDADPKTFRHIVWYWRHNRVPDYLANSDRDMLAADADILGLLDLGAGLRLQKLAAEAHLSVTHHLKYADALYDAGEEMQAIAEIAQVESMMRPQHGRQIGRHYAAEMQERPACPWRRLHGAGFISGPLIDLSTPTASPVKLCLRARALLQYKNPGAAVQAAQSILRAHPHFGEAKAALVQAFAELGRIEEARGVASSRALGISAHGTMAVATCFVAEGDRQLALLAYNSSLSMSPRCTMAYLGRGELQRSLGYHYLAQADFARAAALAPALDEAYGKAGKRYQLRGDYRAAERCLFIATQLRPENAHWQALFGKNYLLSYRGEQAISFLEQAVRLAPSEAPYLFLLSSALDYAEDYPGATDAVLRALALDADNVEYRQHLGDLHHLQGNYAEALNAYHRVNEFAPADLHSLVRMARCLIELGRRVQAKDACQRALAVGSMPREMLETARDLGDCLMELEDFAGALQAFDMCLNMDPSRAECLERRRVATQALEAHAQRPAP